MPNLSYCRFRNTMQDLQECWDNLDEELSVAESSAKDELIRLCKKITDYSEKIDINRQIKEGQK